jgi:YidC/Oxa1 family membrane protein insertase
MPVLANIIEEAFSPLIKLFESIMVFIHAHLVGSSWGLAIVGLTVVTRAVLVPLTYKQLRSMQELQRHAPEMKRIKERYKDDKQRQQQEIMKFYQENKINPLASCLPFALQIPVFISLFYMLRSDLKKHICGEQLVSHYNALSLHQRSVYHVLHATSVAHLPSKYIEATGCQTVAPGSGKFLFIPDITTKATGWVLIVLIGLYIGSQISSTLMATATADPNQRRMMLVLPVVIVAFLFRYPAGLLVYWITTNLWTIGQQYFIRRRMGPSPLAPGKGTGAEGPDGGAGSSNGKPGAPPGAGPRGATAKGEPALAGVAEKTSAPPPPPPRRKKKRSGRRR